ncbi:hypothetical protein KORDIASMS9_04045 [Kordia sp. SMS9]|nr:hypothetical protein KORDIASMS9_04045 [Kordia sp. SMS9]
MILERLQDVIKSGFVKVNNFNSYTRKNIYLRNITHIKKLTNHEIPKKTPSVN